MTDASDLMKAQYVACAAALGWGDLTRLKTKDPRRKELISLAADGYCDASDSGDQQMRSRYISALMLMFWGEAGKMQDACRNVSGYDFCDYASRLYECIEVACGYRAWRSGRHNAEQCIRQAIASRGAATVLYESNLDKNKANALKVSLDAQIADDSDATALDSIDCGEAESVKGSAAAATMVQKAVDSGDVIGGIVLDAIAFSDSTRDRQTSRKAVDPDTGAEISYRFSRPEFSEVALVKALGSLPAGYKRYFMGRYDADEGAVDAAMKRIGQVNSTKLHKFVKDTLKRQRELASEEGL